jgi:hypothetical protein
MWKKVILRGRDDQDAGSLATGRRGRDTSDSDSNRPFQAQPRRACLCAALLPRLKDALGQVRELSKALQTQRA